MVLVRSVIGNKLVTLNLLLQLCRFNPIDQHDLIVGSLRARTLYRLRIEDGQLVDQEKLLTGLARIRDVEVGADGYVYLLLEHGEPGSRLRRASDADHTVQHFK